MSDPDGSPHLDRRPFYPSHHLSCDLSSALEHARILRAAGDPAGAALVLDDAFAAEGADARSAPERVRFRALVLRADLALHLPQL